MTLDIPPSLKIGPYRYDIQIEPETFRDDDGDEWLQGRVNHINSLIRIAAGARHRMFTIMIHEALHAIDDITHAELSEAQIIRLAPAIVSFLIDNGYVKEKS